MTEIKKTLIILKARWPEVALIIGVSILPVLTNVLPRVKILRLMWDFGWLYNIIFSLLMLIPLLILIMLRSGFLRTVYLENQKRQSLAVLLRTGIHFLWRMIVLGALYMIPFTTLTLLSSHLVARWASPGGISFLHRLLPIAFNIILIKFILLIPALVIVLDCRTFASFKFLKQYRLSNAKELVGLFLFKIALGLLWIFLAKLANAATTSHYIFMIAYLTISQFVTLMITVTAVRFVASGVAYDNSPSTSDLQNLPDEEFNIPKED